MARLTHKQEFSEILVENEYEPLAYKPDDSEFQCQSKEYVYLFWCDNLFHSVLVYLEKYLGLII